MYYNKNITKYFLPRIIFSFNTLFGFLPLQLIFIPTFKIVNVYLLFLHFSQFPTRKYYILCIYIHNLFTGESSPKLYLYELYIMTILYVQTG